MTTLFIGIGMVLVIEGLVLALAPSYVEQVAELLAKIPRDQRRTIGLLVAALGVVVLWLTH